MIEAARIYTMSEVAAELQHSTRWFRRERRRLEREGFPPPVSRIGHPRWLGADLLAWLTRPRPELVEGRPGANVTPLRVRRA